ncbi:hypothetical protein J7F03_18430 [Streptomyces sp. ISL-43]|uniref:hypothetical protein n=1 Tax=Streptomyces sp. ISL-43 TaxID=2819183 RepID=UPI001BE88E9C|nr:hypothetical protein [Streptomyces sp. ISL-43]MBT2449038.1 hypothetical protein [Streptomyces sp. ISL-43]
MSGGRAHGSGETVRLTTGDGAGVLPAIIIVFGASGIAIGIGVGPLPWTHS